MIHVTTIYSTIQNYSLSIPLLQPGPPPPLEIEKPKKKKKKKRHQSKY